MLLTPADGCGVSATFYSAPIPAEELPDEVEKDEADQDANDRGGRYGRSSNDVDIPRADVDVEGSSHVFHETRTDVATGA